MSVTKFYPYRITLDAPAIFTSLEAEPNSAVSYPFITGASLRGAVASALISGGNQAGTEPFDTLILSGQVCYLNAYPSAGDQNTFPSPLAFRKEKYQDAYLDLTMFSGHPSENHQIDQDVWPQVPLEHVGSQFLSVGTADILRADARVTGTVHHQRDRVVGRAYRDAFGVSHGAIFTYESVQAGQEFRGSMAITGTDDGEVDSRREQLRRVLTGRGNRLLLGRSLRARYGGQGHIHWEQPPREREVNRFEGIISGDIEPGESFVVLLTSDYLGRDSGTGQVDPAWISSEIIERLQGRAIVLKKLSGFRRVGGYNNTWGMPLPQSLALQSGSVLLLQAEAKIPYGDILALEQSGLGERRFEGYGRVIFLEKPRTDPSVRTQLKNIPNPPADVSPLVRQMQARILEEAMDREIQGIAAEIANSAKNIPSPSLLRRLQLPLRRAANAQAADTSLALFRQLLQSLRPSAVDSLHRCRISLIGSRQSGMRLQQWLQDILGDDFDLGELLGWNALAQRNCLTTSELALELLEEMNPWIRVRFLQELFSNLARLYGRASGGENGNGA